MKIIVVGGGIAGLSSAWALTRRGHQVTVLEQGAIPNPLAASGDHHRIIRRAYGKAAGYGRAITEAYEAWDELWSDLAQRLDDPRGFICLSREPGDEAEQFRDGLVEGSYPLEMIEPDEAVRRWPFIARGGLRYVFFSPEGGVLHCKTIATALAVWLRAHGANVRENTGVASVEADAGAVTLASGERLDADRIVIAVGAWAPKLFPDLAGILTIHRTALAYVEPPVDLRESWASAPVVLDTGGKTGGYIIPPSGGGGLKFGTDLHKRPTADANLDRTPYPGEGEEIIGHLQPSIARIQDYKVSDVVTCAYTFTADERFTALEKGRALVVSACSGHGYKFGAAVGRWVADGVESGDTARLISRLRAEAA